MSPESRAELNATLLNVHSETEEPAYANIETILPCKNKSGEVVLPSGEYKRVKDREGYLQPKKMPRL